MSERTLPSTAWKPGESGNPVGRKPGAELVRKLLEPHREPLVKKAVDMALAGDVTALRICVDRLAPVPRPEAPTVLIPGLKGAITLTEKASAIVDAVGEGHIDPDTASTLLQGLAAATRIAEFDDLSRRIAELERTVQA